MKNILITSAGQRVSLVRAFQQEARKLDTNAGVFTVDMNTVLAPACHVSDGCENVSHANSDDYIADLLSVCEKRGVGVVVPTIDTELLKLSQNKEIFADQGISVVVSSSDFVAICRDKRKTNRFFEDNGIEIPRVVDKYKPTFPLFIKPFDGSLSKDIYVLNSAEELQEHHLQNEKFMFMEYMRPGDYDEFTVDAYYNREGRLCCAVPRKRIFVRSGEINKGVTSKNEIVSFLKRNLGTIEGAEGCLTMQFFLGRNNARIVGIEINPRFGGGYPLSYLAKANYPEWIIQEYLLGEKISYQEEWEDRLLMLRYDDEVLVHDYEG